MSKTEVSAVDPAQEGVVNAVKAPTKLQLDRYHSVYHHYGDEAMVLVKLIKPRGKNSWAPVLTKLDKVNRSDREVRKYNRALTDSFEIGTPVLPRDVVQTVCETRSRFGLDPFTDAIVQQCLNEFAQLFVYDEEILTDEQGNSVKGVKPLFALLAD